MRTLKFKAQPRNAFFATVNQMFGNSLPASNCCRALFRCLNCAQRFDYNLLGSGRKLGGAADREHLIDSSEKRICRFTVRMLLKGAVMRNQANLPQEYSNL